MGDLELHCRFITAHWRTEPGPRLCRESGKPRRVGDGQVVRLCDQHWATMRDGTTRYAVVSLADGSPAVEVRGG